MWCVGTYWHINMQISEETILELVKSQGQLTQAVVDVKDKIDKAIPYLVQQDEKNASAIRDVEKKVWYFGGAGTVIGYILANLGSFHLKLGGK